MLKVKSTRLRVTFQKTEFFTVTAVETSDLILQVRKRGRIFEPDKDVVNCKLLYYVTQTWVFKREAT
jgi:hypothetical protein